ncbi:uncharacterized protein MELLADRAFT_112799 [Melampsora larici-populina 98AG31]|uniref:OTU domain-containing protein n=1 Tax=Melampsora larici-populina (strain 98AG31 / pathotype 3-4-7) TaxID=747676 RepID=F4S7N0_MELLP|nr:uncharacterized protein MELLADRAFT_112799 [Melampsora larici-populina 98AG31]EGF99367.1 hypothetical protein MELLADRAFT_112799 [Melampsora larici-populina 98AG31]
MQTDTSHKYILPVPDIIEINHKDRRKMDEYIESFPATQHGYRIRIGHSHSRSALSQYECYRSGYPQGGQQAVGTTKSARIGCPFEIDTRYLYHSSSWLLIYSHLGHNHPPDPNVKARKKHKDPNAQPILAPGVTLDNDKDQDPGPGDIDADSHDIIDSQTNVLSKSPVHLLNNPSLPSPDIGPNILSPATLTNAKVNTKPHDSRLPNVNQSHSPQHSKEMHCDYHPTQPSQRIKAPIEPHDSLDLTMSSLTARLRAMTPRRRQDTLIKIESIISEALPALVSFKPREPIESIISEAQPAMVSFNPHEPIESIISEAQPAMVSFNPHEPASSQPACSTPLKEAHEATIVETIDKLIDEFYDGPTELTTSTFNFKDLILSQPTENSTVPVDTTTKSPKSRKSSEEDTSLTPTIADKPPPPLLPISPTSLSLRSPVDCQRVTRKRAREAGILQKPHLINPNLPALLAKYRIHTWLEPYVIDLREVKGDGHCGFRAIAISVGQSQEEWADIRSRMHDTATTMPDERTLPEGRTECLARLATTKANVVSEQKYWLSMPAWGGLIATTFNRPVLYYEPGSYSQMVFPFLTPHNLNSPIVLAWADHHFASLLLDFTRPSFPAPRLCGTWRRFHSEDASSWLDVWQPLIDAHAKLIQAQIKYLRKKTKQRDPINLTLSD